jgi:hypothetical protein
MLFGRSMLSTPSTPALRRLSGRDEETIPWHVDGNGVALPG